MTELMITMDAHVKDTGKFKTYVHFHNADENDLVWMMGNIARELRETYHIDMDKIVEAMNKAIYHLDKAYLDMEKKEGVEQ